jgi:hypothetical protein
LIKSLDEDSDLGFVRAITQPEEQKRLFNALLDHLRQNNSEERLLAIFKKRMSRLYWSEAGTAAPHAAADLPRRGDPAV